MTPNDSPALNHTSPEYPYNGTPCRVRITQAVLDGLPDQPGLLAVEGDEYSCYVEADGELAVIVEGELVWLETGEFMVIEWHGKTEEK